MDLNIQIPDNTASIFEYLQKGLFISSNSTSEEVRDMYNEINENYEPLYQYFSQINFICRTSIGDMAILHKNRQLNLCTIPPLK